MKDEFSVVQFFPDGSSDVIARELIAAEAMILFGDYSCRPAAKIGIIKRLIIVDDGDCINAEWCFGKGFTYPPELVKMAKERGLQK